jgi:cephalosporin-C deacetylase
MIRAVYTDLPLAELQSLRSSAVAPDDLDAFWRRTVDASRAKAAPPVVVPVDAGLTTLDVFDVTFSGFDGQPIRAWLRVPAGATGPLPTVVQYVGYGGGRGHAADELQLASAGFAHLHMDTRGQGSGWSPGDTPDVAPDTGAQAPGVMTRGIGSPETYYYRRLMTDAVLAVDAARQLPQVDGDRIAVKGGSQGGALAIAASAFSPHVKAALVRVPFLADFPRAIVITDAYPFREVTDWLRIHRGRAEEALSTLAYFDSSLLAQRASVPGDFTVGLMDEITPPSTVYAAYNAWAGEKQMTVWQYNGHDGGGLDDFPRELAFLRRHLA